MDEFWWALLSFLHIVCFFSKDLKDLFGFVGAVGLPVVAVPLVFSFLVFGGFV